MKTERGNFAFIDAQNVYRGVERLGWRLDWAHLRTYLLEKYDVTKAYFFIGYIPENVDIYTSIQKCGYNIIFKPTVIGPDGKLKGNVDADLVLKAVLTKDSYDRAIIVSSDGDYYSLVDHLYTTKKLELVLSPHRLTCSSLLKKSARGRIQFLDVFRDKMEYK